MSLLGEIKRRKVFQVAAVYAVVAWLTIQIVDVVGEPLNLPGWIDAVVIVLLAVGFPIAVILAWAFDLTPQGIKVDSKARGSSVPAQGNPTASMTILAENPDLAEFLLKANAGEVLAPNEQARLDYYLVRTFFNMEWTYNEVPESVYPIARWRAVMNEPARRRSWEAHEAELSKAFVEFVEENVLNR